MPELHYSNALEKDYRLHWYTIERVLGQGGFGITYLARDTNLDQAVAIKEYLPTEVAIRGEDLSVQPRTASDLERFKWGLDRFLTEARILAKFDHSNIIRVHSIFEANHTAYLVMRYEQGVALNDYLDRHKFLSEQELLDIVLPILDGLKKVHKQGFIHRDIQPANVYIRDDGSPVLLDFGAAREAVGKARTMTILVAPGYAPIEQYFSNGKAQGPWTDIYGLGATLYRAVAGVAPLDAIERSRGLLGSTRDVMMPAIVAGQGRYGEAFLRAIDHALMFNEKDRPQNVEQWEQELNAVGVVPVETPAISAKQDQEPRVRSEPVTRTFTPPPSPAARPRWMIAAVTLSLFLLALIITGFLLLWGDNRSESPEISATADTAEVQGPLSGPVPETGPTVPPQEEIRMEAPENRDVGPDTSEAATTESILTPAMPVEGKQKEAISQEDSVVSADEEQSRQEAEAKRRAEEAKAEIERLLAEQRREEERLTALKEQRRLAEEQLPPEPQELPVVELVVGKEDQELQEAMLLMQNENYPAAMTLLKPLAATGNAMAQYQLARMYRAGRGVLANNATALDWMRRAAWQGQLEAQDELASYYQEGIAGVQDRFLAYTWYLVLERNGNFTRVNERRALEGELQPEQFPQASYLAQGLFQAQGSTLAPDSPRERME